MRILLADDHALFRQALRHVLMELGPETQVIEAEDLSQALKAAAAAPDLDVALLDLKMPDAEGLYTVTTFREHQPAVPLIVLSATEDCENIEAVLDAGAMGYVPKSSAAPVLLGAIRLVTGGGVYLPPILLNRVVAPPRSAPETHLVYGGHSRVEGLTERQIEVLCLLEQGKSNKEIARELSLSEGTIKIHLAAVFRALNVRNRTEAVLAAQRISLPSRKRFGAQHLGNNA